MCVVGKLLVHGVGKLLHGVGNLLVRALGTHLVGALQTVEKLQWIGDALFQTEVEPNLICSDLYDSGKTVS